MEPVRVTPSNRKWQPLCASFLALSTALGALPAWSQSIMTFTGAPTTMPKPTPVFIAPPAPPAAPPTPPPAPTPVTSTTLITPPMKVDLPISTVNVPWIPPVIHLQPRKPKDKPQTTAKKDPEKKKDPQPVAAEPAKRAEPARMQPLPGVFVFSMQCGGGLCNTDNKFEFVPSRGTLYSVESNDHVNLARGHMLIIAGDINVNLTAGKMHVQILPGSSMVAEVDPDGSSRLYTLPSFERTHPAAIIGPQPEVGLASATTLNAGEGAVIANTGLEAEELIAADGLNLAPVEGSLKLVEQTNGRMHLVNYSLKRMLDDEYLIGCRRISVPPTERLSKLRSDLQTAASQEPVNHNKAVSFTEPPEHPSSYAASAKLSTNTSPVIRSKTMTAVADDDSIYNVNDDSSINLMSGTLLVHATKDATINTGFQTVHISKGAIALVKAKSGVTKVTNLSDLANQSVRVISNGHEVDLLPAREVIYTAHAPNLGHIFDVHQIGHNSIVSQQFGTEWVTTSEVALADELMYHPLLVTVRTNPNYKSFKNEFVDQVMKTAAIFQMLHARTTYVRGEVEDETTAYTVIADRGCPSCTK